MFISINRGSVVSYTGYAMHLLTIVFLNVCLVASESISDTFHLVHYGGLGVVYDSTKQLLTVHSTLHQKFKWNGLVLMHVQTRKCVIPKVAEDTLALTDQCNGTDVLFHHNTANKWIKHLISGKCFHFNRELLSNGSITLANYCDANDSKFWKISEALYTIRHFSGLCLVYNSITNIFRLQKTHICDRFTFDDQWHFQHYGTGKCVQLSASYMRLKTDCISEQTRFTFTKNSTLHQHSSNQCIKPLHGGSNAAVTTALVLGECKEGDDQFKFVLYPDRGMFQVHLLSESCADAATCAASKSMIQVNGYDFSFNGRGINVASFDYQSGIMEYQQKYDIFYNAQRLALISFLDSLVKGKLLLMVAKDSVSFSADLAAVLQRYGLSSNFASTSITNPKMSMAAILYTGNERKKWEQVIHKIGGVDGPTTIDRMIYVFRDYQGMEECDEEMGIRTGRLPDSQFSAKSLYPGHFPYNARLHKKVQGWCAGHLSPVSDYIQLDLASIKVLSGIALQTHGTIAGYWPITSFNIEYSLNGAQWHAYSENFTAVQFRGCSPLGDIKVNWFRRTPARFFRIVPASRQAGMPSNCMRMELFGCAPKGPFLHDKFFEGNKLEVSNTISSNITFYGTPDVSGNVSIGMSVSEQNKTLSNYSDQLHITSGSGLLFYANGTLGETTSIVKQMNEISPFNVAASTQFTTNATEFSNFYLQLRGRITDNGKGFDAAWGTISYQTERRSCIFSHRVAITTPSPYYSHLCYTIDTSNATNSKLSNGDEIPFDFSVSHQIYGKNRSTSNAYNVKLLVMYEASQLKLKQFDYIRPNNRSIAATRNITKAGLIEFQTDALCYLCNQLYRIIFTVDLPSTIIQANELAGSIVIDFSYNRNLLKFNSAVAFQPGNIIPYHCQFMANKISVTSYVRLDVPYLSIAYDDVRNDLFFCIKKEKHLPENRPVCYWYENERVALKYLPFIASVVGIDTATRNLFGIDRRGNGYVRLEKNFTAFWFVDDAFWTSIEDSPQSRKAKTTYGIAGLPAAVSESWVFQSSGQQKWAATKRGILKKEEGEWKRIVEF